ncbi:MAG TPA: glucose-6-phosphate dehydrogenase [Desulfobulbus sp.]|nr:glucose-6-phosphate dehydrogenase [Desulfobulbus sp.]
MKIRVNQENDAGSCEIATGSPCGYVIFGASGDLTRRKLLPAVFSLFRRKKIPDNFFLVGFARTGMDDDAFRQRVRDAISQTDDKSSQTEINAFVMRCFYVAGGYDQDEGYLRLKNKIKEAEIQFSTGGNLVFHIATPPSLYATIVTLLGKNQLVWRGCTTTPFQRVIIEKPFGRDLASSVQLNKDLLIHLCDEQIYRIDHYLGKETVQNILMFRFANQIFEPAWNRNYIDHVQITVAEDIGVEHRAGYFEQAGLLRDMFQNHILQLATLVGMEPPVDLSADSIRDERVKFMKSIRPFDLDNLHGQLIRGQYGAGKDGALAMKAYREEQGVGAASCVETYFAMKLQVDNGRWQGVPFYIQTGKRLEKKLTRITVVFNKVPHCMFNTKRSGFNPAPNRLIFNIQPQQAISLLFQAKVPGSKMCLSSLAMELDYHETFGEKMDEDYSTLILDCMLGDQTLFWRKDSVETSWKLLTPVLEQWESCNREAKKDLLHGYIAGGWGPEAGQRFIEEDGRTWFIE